MSGEIGIGVIGCGMVSHAYLGTIARTPGLGLRALASLGGASAEARASSYGGVATTTDALLADESIAVVVNLAPPSTRRELGRRILEAGKHLYSEKPFATKLEDADDLLNLAASRGLLIGCAPDTFLGEGHQLVRKIVDEGAIGAVTSGAVAFGTAGMESWHPNPAFFYSAGGGPLLDVGPYYLTQLVNLLGPVAEVTAIGSMPRERRVVSAPGCEATPIEVEVPTTVNGALRFEQGANVSLSMSWDVAAHRRAPIELYGETGSLIAPDPNQFGGCARISRDGGSWDVIGEESPAQRIDFATLAAAMAALGKGIDPVTGRPVDSSTALRFGDRRGLGLIDLVEAIRTGRAPHASGVLARHVLEVLLALEHSAREGGRIAIRSRVERPPSQSA